ncbi:RNA polymerase recycling motor ATPase HelR [Gordonia otitidis]|uniref:RNA polymerase recycling motor ATPase HelR n=1 Tax=Gordonia otitidis TaxID=249058 RepID=UPI002356A87C|nr:RNA polymerase recycling motor ATPase HelR [Gordonia otitidis]
MPAVTDDVFDLPTGSPKSATHLIDADVRHFRAATQRLAHTIETLDARRDAVRKADGGGGRRALDRDLEVHELDARLRTLHRFGLDLCIGRMTMTGHPDPVYIGRVGLTDHSGTQLLVDWRTPAAAPFFTATTAQPMGVRSRRRYRWAHGQIVDYWDEVFTPDAADEHVWLDGDSALLAGLGASRTPRMRDVLSTIAADQDAIIRAGSGGTLVVDGGPGTGKTVVALHRAAYLLYSDPRLSRGRLLIVGPHDAYLAYVADVLPSLGEEGVQTCTLRDLAADGGLAHAASSAIHEDDETVARLKSTDAMVDAIETAVCWYEEPPTEPVLVDTQWAAVTLTPADWAESFAAPEPGTPHNEAREAIWQHLADVVRRRTDDTADIAEVREALQRNEDVVQAVVRHWPMLDAADLVGDLWTVPAFLRMCAPWLTPAEVRLLQRPRPDAWTDVDLPLLDAARARLGDPDAEARTRRRAAALRAERRRMDLVVGDLLESVAYDDGEGLMSMLRRDDLRDVLVDPSAAPVTGPAALDGPFAHVIVDEAQELTQAQWRMLLRRTPTGSFTVVGDRAQARAGFTESWSDRLCGVGCRGVRVASLSVNYRTPAEIMAAAEPVIRAAIPDANVPSSIRESGIPVRHVGYSERAAVLTAWLEENDEGIACVIGDPSFVGTERVRALDPLTAKGLEFDLVVVVESSSVGNGITEAVDRYVSMTRATRELVILHTDESGHDANLAAVTAEQAADT